MSQPSPPLILPDNQVIAVDDLSVRFQTSERTVDAVKNLSFHVARGETLAIMGLLPPRAVRAVQGRIRFDGRDLLQTPERDLCDLRGNRMAMVFQEPMSSLNPVLTIGRQVAETVRVHRGVGQAEAWRAAVEALERVRLPDAARRANQYPHQLSGGMRQRVMIAMALVCRPRLLIADEPTTALDVTIQAQILELLRRVQAERGMGMLLITHDLGVVAQMAQRVGVMYAGELVEEAPRDAFFSVPRHPYTQKLFAALPDLARRGGRLETIAGQVPSLSSMPTGCRFAARCPHAWARCRAEAPDWHQAGPGHRVRCHLLVEPGRAVVSAANSESPAAVVAPAADRALLRVDDLRVHFPIRSGVLQRTVGHVYAVDGVTLELVRGRTLALVGESGCGKTTVGKAILQLIKPSGGSVRLDGRASIELCGLAKKALRPLRRRMQMIFQDPFASLNPRLSVGEIISEGMNALAPQDDRAAAIAALLRQVGLDEDAAQRYPHEFSGGQRQRIAIARVLAVQPELIVCDEPTSALDVSVQAQILNLLGALQRDLGLAYLFITHNFAVVKYLAHEVAVMYLGRIVEQGSVDEVLRAPRHPYTRALLSAVPSARVGESPPLIRLSGEQPSPARPPAGCHFHPRCAQATDVCRLTYPETCRVSESHLVRCHLFRKTEPV